MQPDIIVYQMPDLIYNVRHVLPPYLIDRHLWSDCIAASVFFTRADAKKQLY